jgi:HEPN domain-containing protein
MVSKELEGAKDDLETAKKSLKAGDYKWATIQAY